MYALIKKSILTFLLLNGLIVSSAMADMLFYYSAGILPSIAAGGKKDCSEAVNKTLKGSFTSSDVSDSYTFTAQSTGEVLFAWNENINIELYQGTTYLGYDSDGWASFAIVEGVTYTIKVINNSGLNIDAYNVNVVTTNDERCEAVALIPNRSYTDTLNDNNDSLRVYNFVANTTGVATVKSNWNGTTQDANTYVYENGIYRGYDYGSDHSAMSFDIVNGKTYSIVQRFTDTGLIDLDYNIEVITPNDTRGDAVSVIPNQPYIRTINQNKDSMDVYNFTATSNGTAFARADWWGTTNYAYIYIYENGVYKSYDYGSGGIESSFNIIAGHNYTVRVDFTDTDNLDINYGFEVVTTNDPRGDAVTLSANSHYNTTMHESENFLDVYNFTATSTGSARAMVGWYGTTNYGYIYLYENGVYKSYDYGSSNNELSFDTVAGSTYTIITEATDTDSVTQNYSFNFATTDQANATTVNLGQVHQTTLNENTNTYATYSFTPETDMSATALANWDSSSSYYGYIYLYENGVYKSYDYGSGSSGPLGFVNRTFSAGKTYTFIFRVTDTDNHDTDITFSIQ